MATAPEDARGLLSLDLTDDAFRRAIESLGTTVDSESVCLLDPHRFGIRLPAKTKLTVEASFLSHHQWRRYEQGKRNDPTGCADPPSFARNEHESCSRAMYAFCKRECTIRFARKTDINALEKLEELCWIPPLRASRQRLKSRIENYPQGQFVLERNAELKGVIYSQRIQDEADLHRCTMDDVHQLHDPVGDVVQLLAVNIHPDSQNLACGDQLLEFMLQRSSLQRGVRKIVAVTLCKDFSAKQGLAFEEYIAGPGKDRDRVLHFHHLHGAQIGPALPGYHPRDVANEGKGVLVTYDPTRRRSSATRKEPERVAANAPPHPARSVGREVMQRFILDDLAVSEEIRRYPDHERSTTSTRMW